jgi:protein gp37
LVPSVADFKHYFSVHVPYLERARRTNFVCRLSDLFREDVSQRFAAYLGRIGLPGV